MEFSVSQLRDFIRCPQYAYFRHIVNKWPRDRKPSEALEIGTMFHKYMAAKLKGHNMSIEEQSAMAPNSAILEAWLKYKLWLAADAWSIPDDWTLGPIERPMVAPITNEENDPTLCGTLDYVVKVDGKWWSGQWKTYEDDLAGLVERVRIGWHERVAYAALAQAYDFTPFAGTILGAVRKLPSYRLVADPDTGKKRRVDVTDEDRAGALTFHWLAYEYDVNRLDDMIYYARELKKTTSWGADNIRNPDACWGMYGNSRCPYYETCHGATNIDSPEYITLEPRYTHK